MAICLYGWQCCASKQAISQQIKYEKETACKSLTKRWNTTTFTITYHKLTLPTNWYFIIRLNHSVIQVKNDIKDILYFEYNSLELRNFELR